MTRGEQKEEGVGPRQFLVALVMVILSLVIYAGIEFYRTERAIEDAEVAAAKTQTQVLSSATWTVVRWPSPELRGQPGCGKIEVHYYGGGGGGKGPMDNKWRE